MAKSSRMSRSTAIELAQLGLVAVIEAGVLERLEHLVGADREDGRAAPAGDVTERVREEGLADADGADDGDVGMGFEEPQRHELVEERPIEASPSLSLSQRLETHRRDPGAPSAPAA